MSQNGKEVVNHTVFQKQSVLKKIVLFFGEEKVL